MKFHILIQKQKDSWWYALDLSDHEEYLQTLSLFRPCERERQQKGTKRVCPNQRCSFAGKGFFFFVGLVNSEVIKRHILYQKHAGILIETFFFVFVNRGCLDQFTRTSTNLTNSKINDHISLKWVWKNLNS
jgi:hypothetical protein